MMPDDDPFAGFSDTSENRKARQSQRLRETKIRIAYHLIYFGLQGSMIGFAGALGGRLSGDEDGLFPTRCAYGVVGTAAGAVLGLGWTLFQVAEKEIKAEIVGGIAGDPALAFIRGMVLFSLFAGSCATPMATVGSPNAWIVFCSAVVGGAAMTVIGAFAGLVDLIGKNSRRNKFNDDD